MPKRYLFLAILTIAVILRVQFGIPTPSHNDISHQINPSLGRGERLPTVEVTGIVATRPKPSKTKKGQHRLTFVLNAQHLDHKQVTGQVWVRTTLASGIKPPLIEDKVTITGWLRTPTNYPKSNFDFQAFLQRRGIFTTANGRLTHLWQRQKNPITRLQQYFYDIQRRWVPPDLAALQVAMVIGDRAIALPKSLEDSFRACGMTHVMVVSGFQIVLILSVVSSLVQKLKPWQTFAILLAVSLTFLLLTGIQPSIARATVMAMLPYLLKCFQFKLKPIETVFWAGGLLLLVAPMWLYELGFQLSFLATLGLVTSTDWLLTKLHRLPTKLAEAIATPVVAMVWVQPLVLTTFGTFPTYSLVANISSAPLVEAITIGGFIVTLVSTIPFLSPLASGLSWLLSFPTQLLVGLVKLLASFPGASLTIPFPAWACVLTYALLILLVSRFSTKP